MGWPPRFIRRWFLDLTWTICAWWHWILKLMGMAHPIWSHIWHKSGKSIKHPIGLYGCQGPSGHSSISDSKYKSFISLRYGMRNLHESAAKSLLVVLLFFVFIFLGLLVTCHGERENEASFFKTFLGVRTRGTFQEHTYLLLEKSLRSKSDSGKFDHSVRTQRIATEYTIVRMTNRNASSKLSNAMWDERDPSWYPNLQ